MQMQLLAMAVLHSYAQSADQTGYYLKGWTPGTGHTTIQTRRVCEDLFDWLGFSVGDQIPHDLLNGLLEVDLLYTGNPTTAAENIPDDFDIERDVKNVLTKEQYDRLVGFTKSYGDQTPSRVEDLLDQLNAQTTVVDDSYIPDTPGGNDRRHGNTGDDVDHGRFEGIIEDIYRGDGDEEIIEPLSDIKDEYRSADAAISYHQSQQEITEATFDGNWLEYATRAIVNTDDGISAGPICGFRVDVSDTEIVVVEVIVRPDDPTIRLTYGDQGVRHRAVLGDEASEWQTTLPERSKYADSFTRSELLEHQRESVQILETTLERHPGISKQGIIEQIAGGGYLERGVRTTSDVWQDSSLLGELLASPSPHRKVTGTVGFFNDSGGYGFIKTDAHDEDVFYHMEDIGGPDIEEGQRLRFDINEQDKGPRATDVERL